MRKRKHLVLVIHGARADNPALRHLVEWVRGKGHLVQPRITWEPGDAATFAREGAAAGADVVVAVGGDGTVNEVLNGLSGSDTPLGIVPLGTANDFAKQAGIPADADHAMDVILRRKPTRIDTAELNGRRFLNVSTAGVGAEATAETPAEAKESLGPLAYAITGVRKLADLTPVRASFRGPGFEHDGEFLLFAVGNGRVTGGGTHFTPRARVTDGMLDLCIIPAMPLSDFTRLLLRVKKGEHLAHEQVQYVQLPEVRITSELEMSVNVDGENTTARELGYRVRHADLLVHVAQLPEDAE